MQSRTSDFYLTCYLTLVGEQIKSVKRLDHKKLEFEFGDSNKFNKLKDQFFWNQAQVDPLAFSDQIKKIKTIIYNN